MPTTPSLKARALRLLAQREHSRHELRRKLLRRAPGDDGERPAVTPDDVDRLLDALEQQGWLSDDRFATVRTQARAARFGHRHIRDELARHGIELDADTDASLRASELERARTAWARRYGQPPADVAERARQMRFLAGRGFAHDVVRRAVPPPASAEPADD